MRPPFYFSNSSIVAFGILNSILLVVLLSSMSKSNSMLISLIWDDPLWLMIRLQYLLEKVYDGWYWSRTKPYRFWVLLIYSFIHLMKFNELNFRVRFKVVMQVLFSGFFWSQLTEWKLSFAVLEISPAVTAYASFSVNFHRRAMKHFDTCLKYFVCYFVVCFIKMFKYQWTWGVISTCLIYDNK